LSLSEVAPLPSEGPYSMEGNSLLYLALKLLSFGQVLPTGGMDVNLHPIAFAGWAALLVTSLNLIPAGQLDGGHVAYALLGARARYLAWAVLALLLALSIWWQGWLLWAALVFFFSRRALLPLDDVSPLNRTEVVVALVLLALFVLTFTPIPLRLIM
jgi:membrane-associated protease RseP (regulator of RpoE activity)